MQQYLNRIKTKIYTFSNEERDKRIVIALSIIMVIFFFFNYFYLSPSNDGVIPNETILINRTNYQVTYNNETDSYKVRVKTGINNTEDLIDTIDRDLKENLTEEEYSKVQWDLPGTLLPKNDQITEYSSEEDLKEHLEMDLRNQRELNEGTFLPDGH